MKSTKATATTATTKAPSFSKVLLVTACTLLTSDAAFISTIGSSQRPTIPNRLSEGPNVRLNYLNRDAEEDSIVMTSSNLLLSSTCAATSCLTDGSTSSFPQHFSSISQGISDALNNPNVESEILSDVAHFALDLFTFMTPEKWLLRFAALIGRVCSISADYIPDNYIKPDEVVFQSIMLFVSTFLFAQSTFPMAVAGFSTIARSAMEHKLDSKKSTSEGNVSTSSWKNLFAWNYLFKPAGLSLFQFHCLSSLGVIDWVDVEPNKILVDKKGEPSHLFWMYRGSAELYFNGSAIEYLEPNEGPALCLFADMNFLCQLEMKKIDCKRKASDKYDVPLSCKLRNQAIIRSGESGARLMRLNKKKLVELMDIDPDLNDSIQNLLVKGMQRMLDSLLSVEQPLQPVKTVSLQNNSADDGVIEQECILSNTENFTCLEDHW